MQHLYGLFGDFRSRGKPSECVKHDYATFQHESNNHLSSLVSVFLGGVDRWSQIEHKFAVLGSSSQSVGRFSIFEERLSSIPCSNLLDQAHTRIQIGRRSSESSIYEAVRIPTMFQNTFCDLLVSLSGPYRCCKILS